MPQQEFLGFKALRTLEMILLRHKPRRIFLVTGKDSYTSSGAKSLIEPLLKTYKVTQFNDFETNPKLLEVERGLMLFRKRRCDFVVAVGGGSALDVAKSIRILAANPGKPIAYVKGKSVIRRRGASLVAVPTTSGSGSEATHFAVVYIDKTKYSLAHRYLLPEYAIVDPQLTLSLPKMITAQSGIDALAQAIESYWSIHSTAQSKLYARAAIVLAVHHLSKSVNDPSRESRAAMAKAAHLSGKAINITKTTACHALSYPMTAFFNVPHGQAVAFTLARMLAYNAAVTAGDLADARGVLYVKKTINEIAVLLGAQNSRGASKKITSIMSNIGLSLAFREVGVKTKDDLGIIMEHGFSADRMVNNPRRVRPEPLERMLQSLL